MRPIKKLQRSIARLETPDRNTTATYLRMSLDYFIRHGRDRFTILALKNAVERVIGN